MRLIDADLLKNNIKSWAENIKGCRTDNKCFFTEENMLSAIDGVPTVESKIGKYEIYSVSAEMFQCNEHFPNCIWFWLNWEANVGFGQLSFVYDTKENKWSYDSEYMSKEFCRAVLDKWLEDMMIGE